MSLTSSSRNFIRIAFPLLILLIVLFTPGRVEGQDAIQDSLQKDLSHARTDEDKVNTLMYLSDYCFALNNELSGNYAAQALQVAELSRDRKLIISVYLRNGVRYLNHSNELTNNIRLAEENYQHAEDLARENGLDEELAYSYIGLAGTTQDKGQYSQALNYCNLALAIAGGGKSDSLKIMAYDAFGDIYLSRNEKLLAFRSYLEAMDIAELSKADPLRQIAYNRLANFYAALNLYDKAIDYKMKVMDIDRKHLNRIRLLWDYFSIGLLFSKKNQIELARAMFEHAIALADSLHAPQYKLDPYHQIADLYFRNNETAKGIAYLNKHPEVDELFRKVGLQFYLDQEYGKAYEDLGKFDSAYYYFKKSEPEVEAKANLAARYDFYDQFGTFYKTRGDNKTAIAYFLKTREIGKEINDLTMLETSARNLDTLYNRAGNYKTAYSYNMEYNLYKDSIKTMSRDADMLRLEVENDNKRRERLAKEDEEQTLHRHNVQYMGFTVGLVGLFVLLAMLGLFVVSTRTIRTLGFFSFIFLFEFIILLADKQIHEVTHGEPWMVLLIKIGLAAILLPLHHWLEHRVIHYLTSRRKIAVPGTPVLGQLFRKKES